MRILFSIEKDLVQSNKFVWLHVELQKYNIHKLDNISQEFLRNAFACAVYGELHIGTGKHHGSCKHGYRDGLSKAPWCDDQDFLRCRIPRINFQNSAMCSGKGAWAISLEKNTSATFKVLFVKNALMERAIPASPISVVIISDNLSIMMIYSNNRTDTCPVPQVPVCTFAFA